jgi:hypothetical protein
MRQLQQPLHHCADAGGEEKRFVLAGQKALPEQTALATLRQVQRDATI